MKSSAGNRLLTNEDRIMLLATGAVFAGALAYAALNHDLALAIVVGLGLLAAALVCAARSRGGLGSQIALPLLGMAMVALMIHVARGHAETHFAVFAFLAVTIVYRSPLPILVGAGTIAVHHLSFNFFQQWGWGPICFTEPSLARVFEHAAYVVVQSAVLLVLAARMRADFRTAQTLARVAEELVDAQGNVSFAVARIDSQDATTAKLIGALRQVEQAIMQVRQAADSIGTASSQIASGNQDLSGRTEQTAANLQQAASSMEQLTGTVAHSADSAAQANQLASSAADVARRGGSVVAQVVSTMDDISASSRKIADIIGVIDGIAFQTNILALNAAVEAARAGEQGRGFAVVAGEVRSLAQRSAEAAREIKQLIGSSVDKVETGSRLVGDAGSTMTEIVASVQRVSDIIGEISAASREQSSGIAQVNSAVADLDRMTQQNAALVEQSAAAAHSLEDQARRLTQVVATFRLDASAGTHAATPAAVAAQAMARAALPAASAQPAARAAAPTARPATAAATRYGAKPAAKPAARPTAAAAGKPATTAASATASATTADGDWQTF